LRLIRYTIRQARLAALYISHDLPVVAQIADEIMVLRHGKTVEFGSVRDVIERPGQDYTRRLVSVQLAARTDHAAPATQEMLSCEAIRASYGPIEVIKGVSIALDAGRTLAVVGESGSGKSSLARALTGLLTPTHGTVRLSGVELSPGLKGRTLETRRQMQFIYQNPDIALNPRLRVRSILARPLQLYFKLDGAALHARLAELMEQMEMSRDLLNRLPGELSGGQKQRVCIARALAARPTVIICDEVTSALDPLVADGIAKLLKRIQAETGISYLVITHDMAFVKSMSDHVAVMRSGEVVESGKTEDILLGAKHEYTQRLIRSVPKLEVDWLVNALV
jgi:ABC-type glutathione transport system ATPase component